MKGLFPSGHTRVIDVRRGGWVGWWLVAVLLPIGWSPGAPLLAWDEGIDVTPMHDDVMESIRGALAMGDAERLMRLCMQRIDITVLGTSERVSCSQAYRVTQSFFERYPPLSIRFASLYESNGNRFALGEYRYQLGKAPMSIYIHVSEERAGWMLRELRIDRWLPSS